MREYILQMVLNQKDMLKTMKKEKQKQNFKNKLTGQIQDNIKKQKKEKKKNKYSLDQVSSNFQQGIQNKIRSTNTKIKQQSFAMAIKNSLSQDLIDSY